MEAAKLNRAGEWRILAKLALPLLKPMEEFVRFPVVVLNKSRKGGYNCRNMLAYYNVVDIAPGIKRINSEEGSACDLIIGTKKAGLIEGDEFDLGGITIKVFVAPGHSVGSRAYFVPERKILYVGDSHWAYDIACNGI